MEEPAVARYGTWASPIGSDLVAGATITFNELAVDGGFAYWLEGRPAQRGRRALVRWAPGHEPRDVLPAHTDTGSRVHEYGGGAYAVRDGTIVYSERSDDSVWVVDGDAAPRLVTNVPGCRYAGFAIAPGGQRAYAVREDHRDRPATAPDNAIVELALDALSDPATNEGRLIACGSDFVLAPQLSPDGTQLAWIAWDHPAMPWDASRLYLGRIGSGGDLNDVKCVAGDGGGESIASAMWTPRGTLVFTSDRTNWWNAYALRGDRIEALAPADAEFAEPPWVFGRQMLVPLGAGRMLCAYIRNGIVHPALISGGTVHDLPYGPVDTSPQPLEAGAVYIAAPPDGPARVTYAPKMEEAAHIVVRSASDELPERGNISAGEPFSVPTGDGEVAHAVFYPPANARFTGPAGERPPLVVMSHGGPTSMHATAYAVGLQWWTSRGFAVAHVNYRGSSGFGRAYRNRLALGWGVVDVEDCISVARHLIAGGRVDPERIAIRGSSASGMTALLAVATSDVFRVAGSLYGVMELEALAGDTHKFEARYVDGLLGPLPDALQTYRDRSPVHHAGTIDVPVILFQGLDDRVVPPSQATAMRDALHARGIHVEYEEFAGEGHGFRKAETTRRVVERELAFYREAFGLTV